MRNDKIVDLDYSVLYDSELSFELMRQYLLTLELERNSKQYNYSVKDTAKLQQLIDLGQFELAEMLQIGLIESFNNK